MIMGMVAAQMRAATGAAVTTVIGVALITTGGGGGTWVHVDINGNTIATPAASWFNAHTIWGGLQDVTLDSQAMVAVPKFYVRRAVIASGANAGKQAWWIAHQPTTGFRLHSAFRNAGADINQFYVGKYQASMQSTKLASVAGVMPAVSRSMTQFIADAAARNVSGTTGFMLWSAFQWSALQWLYLVEHATMDSQNKTGAGRVNETAAANVDAADVAQATYRGVVGLWGNVRQLLDGLKTVSGVVNLWDQNGNKGWISTGRTRAAQTGIIYPTTFMDGAGASWDLEDVFLGDTGPSANADATLPDYQYQQTSGEVFTFAGGSYNNADVAGLWYILIGVTQSATSTSTGARMAKV